MLLMWFFADATFITHNSFWILCDSVSTADSGSKAIHLLILFRCNRLISCLDDDHGFDYVSGEESCVKWL
ncbi:hypothetical protein AAC387_Pa08g1357 [Persea americana]